MSHKLSDANNELNLNDNSRETTDLLKAVFKYKDGLQRKKILSQLHQKDGEAASDVKVLKSVKSSLRWFFYSKKEKEDFLNAYADLSSLLEGSYGESARNVTSGDKTLTDEQVWNDFNNDQFSYLNILEDISPGILGTRYGFDAAVSDARYFQTIIWGEEEQIRSLKEKVYKSACSAQQHLAYAELAKVPIEQLKNEVHGARLKPLKEMGYNSVADIYSASQYELSSIYGITDYRAMELKNAASRYERKIAETAKLKISSDHRTDENTNLLKAIFRYKRESKKKPIIKSLHEQDNIIASNVEILNFAEKGFKWFSYSEKERKQFVHAYVDLTSLLQGPYGEKVHKLKPDKTKVTSEEAWDDFNNDPISYFNIIEETNPGLLGNGDSKYGLPEKIAREIQDEDFFQEGLKCKLRRYQEWGVKYILHQKKVLLGDEMGLGKTVQAIATMVSLKNTGATHFMVICPASVMTNWVREIAAKSKLKVLSIHGTNKMQAFHSWQKNGGVAVTTYETTASFKSEKCRINLLVVDEAHYIKNPNANRSVNVRKIAEKADRLLFMSGTPLENKVDEMVSLISILRPDIARNIKKIAFMSMAPQFREAISPVYYRRKREDVLTELPDLEKADEWCDLKPAEREIYEASVFARKFMEMRQVSWNVNDLRGSSKAEHLEEIIKQVAADGRKIIVFSYFLKTIKKIADAFQNECYGPITGSVSPVRRQKIVDSFEKSPSGSILLSQIQAGGTGLNIQSASVVILCEPQIKPSIENQAISRCYRMGQTRNVLVYRLLCSDSVDEKILARLSAKQAQFDAFADKSAAAENSTGLDNNSIQDIIQMEIDRIKKERGAGSRVPRLAGPRNTAK